MMSSKSGAPVGNSGDMDSAVKRVEVGEPKEKAFHNWRAGAFHLTFENGNYLSTTFAPGSYSDNHDARFPLNDKFVLYQSETCEIMFDCGKRLKEKIEKRFGDGCQPIGYLSLKDWSTIVNLLATQRRKSNSPSDKGDTTPTVS